MEVSSVVVETSPLQTMYSMYSNQLHCAEALTSTQEPPFASLGKFSTPDVYCKSISKAIHIETINYFIAHAFLPWNSK